MCDSVTRSPVILGPWRDHQRELEKLGEQKKPLRAKRILERDPLVDTASFILSFICSINIYFMPIMSQALCETAMGRRFIYYFAEQLTIEHLLCTGHCAKLWRYNRNKTDKNPCLPRAYILVGRQKINKINRFKYIYNDR